MKSLEIRPEDGDNRFCCCDSDTCKNNANKFSSGDCDSRCDTYFVLSFSESENLVPFPVTMFTGVSGNSDPTTPVNYGFLNQFNVSSSAIEQV